MLLHTVDSPAALKRLSAQQLPALAAEIRAHLISAVSRTGGHLGPNLGVVELTIALHRVFASPRDAIIWDTGHQAYVHKLLTGRQDLSGLRCRGGVSGYPARAESEHDLVENSHASTALSYADGLAKAFALRGESGSVAGSETGSTAGGESASTAGSETTDGEAGSGEARRAVVAVVGDGALTGGMCWEALNNIAAADRPVVIVLNDNGRSYSPTIGVVGSHLAALRGRATGPVPSGRRPYTVDSCLFTTLGLAYLGPVDGHDTGAVESALREARALGAPVVVHCVTRKGQGYPPAEADEADRMHAINPAPAVTPAVPSGPSWTKVLADELVAVGHERPDVVALTAAMLGPTGLQAFARQFPDRVYDVGIAEQHAVTSAAGLAMGGLHPVVCVYATFLNRAFDQLLMDVALHRLPVTFVLDRAGVTGSDGPSHNGMWDLSLLGLVPGMRVAAPRDAERLRALLREAVAHADGPSAIRFPKAEVGPALPAVGRLAGADVLRAGPGRTGTPGGACGSPGGEVLILAVGPLAGVALEAAGELARSGTGVTVADPRWILPVDPALVRAAGRYRLVVTVEDNGTAGGFGDAFARAARAAGVRVPVRTLGLRQEFLPHGGRGGLLAEQGLDSMGIVSAIKEAFGD